MKSSSNKLTLSLKRRCPDNGWKDSSNKTTNTSWTSFSMKPKSKSSHQSMKQSKQSYGGISQDYVIMKLSIGQSDIEHFKQVETMVNHIQHTSLERVYPSFSNENQHSEIDITTYTQTIPLHIMEELQKITNKTQHIQSSNSTHKDITKQLPTSDMNQKMAKNPKTKYEKDMEQLKRRELILNSGVRRHVYSTMSSMFHHEEWPLQSEYACWNCCHCFETPPVGIPEKQVRDIFYLYGNFCSYECAMRYLLPVSEDDTSLSMCLLDMNTRDELSERIQLLHTLCHCIYPNLSHDFQIQRAPPRLHLKLFGGTMSIDEYRKHLTINKKYTIYRPPMVPILYKIEECEDLLWNDGQGQQKEESSISSSSKPNHSDYIPLDKKRVQLALQRRRLRTKKKQK